MKELDRYYYGVAVARSGAVTTPIQEVRMTENGSEQLHDERKAAISYGLEQYQRMSQEREEAIRVRDELQVTVRGYKVAMEAQDARILDLESRNNSLTIERDAAVAHRTKWEVLFASMLAQLRAFEVPNEPLIRDKTHDQLREMLQAQNQYRPQDDALATLQRLVETHKGEQ